MQINFEKKHLFILVIAFSLLVIGGIFASWSNPSTGVGNVPPTDNLDDGCG